MNVISWVVVQGVLWWIQRGIQWVFSFLQFGFLAATLRDQVQVQPPKLAILYNFVVINAIGIKLRNRICCVYLNENFFVCMLCWIEWNSLQCDANWIDIDLWTCVCNIVFWNCAMCCVLCWKWQIRIPLGWVCNDFSLFGIYDWVLDVQDGFWLNRCVLCYVPAMWNYLCVIVVWATNLV